MGSASAAARAPARDRWARALRRVDPWLWAVLGLQLVLCLPGMASRSLWLDEAYSAVTARGSLLEIRDALLRDNGPPLHYVVLHLWRALAGESALALRFMSLVFVLGTTVLVHGLGARLFDLRVARTAALLWAVNPLAVFHANQVRMYGLLVFLATAFVSALWRPAEAWTWRRGVALAISMAALVYTHNGAWFVVGAGLAAAAVLARGTVFHPAPMTSGLLAVASYVPWVPVLARQLADAERITWWMRYYWSPWNPVHSVAVFVPLGRETAFTGLPGLSWPWWIPAIVPWIIPLVIGALVRGPARVHGMFLVLFLLLGLAGPAIWSGAWRPIYVPGKFDFAVLPAFLLVCSSGIRHVRASIGGMLIALLMAASVTAVVGWWRWTPERAETEWTAILRAGVRPGDVVICGPLTLPQARHALPDRGVTFLSVPSALAEQPAIFDPEWYEANVNLDADARQVARSAGAARSEGGRVWVIAASKMSKVNGSLLDELGRSRLHVARRFSSPRMGLQHLRWPIELIQLEPSQDSGRGTTQSTSGP